uniref:THAP-type domain-containing protein n=1 Tax=Strigamia maritima TaxID=126957 RepID=T1IM23_STRMM
MSLKLNIRYNAARDKLEGFEEYGNEGTGKICTHALVFMIRGLGLKWKQTIAYAFTCQGADSLKLKSLLFEMLQLLKKSGLNVKAIVCDQGANNLKLMKDELQVTAAKPYFEMEDSKIYCLYDVPHLIKNIKNCFLKHDIEFDNDKKVAKWSDLQQFFEVDQSLPLHTAPKLSPVHLNPPAFTRMKVKLATQILSHSVYAGMMFYMSHGNIK